MSRHTEPARSGRTTPASGSPRERESIRYADLTDDHLKNIIAHLKRRHLPAKKFYPNLWREYGRCKAEGVYA